MKYFKKSNMMKNSSGTLTLDLSTMTARSYSWYILGQQTKIGYVLNDYSYSPTTVKHVHKLRRYLNEQGIEFQTIDAPKGLQDLDSAVQYYQSKINNLNLLINKKGTRLKTNLDRMRQIETYREKLDFINSLKENTKN